MASKGSADSNQETGTKRHLQPLDVFSGLLVRAKWSGLCPEPRWRSLQCSRRPSSLLPPFQELLSHPRPSASNFTISP